LLPAQDVQPYVRRNKTDRADAAAFLEAARCDAIQPVAVKTPAQQAVQALHRVGVQWPRTRTARLNCGQGDVARAGIPDPSGRRARDGRVSPRRRLPDRRAFGMRLRPCAMNFGSSSNP